MSRMSFFGGPIKRGDASAVIKIDADTHFAVAYSKEYEQSKATEKPTEQSIPESNRATPRAYRELRGGTAVMLTVQKQPDADTIALDKRIDLVLESLRQELPADVKIETEIFRQSDFIEAAVTNVSEAVRDGAIWVVVILFLLMGNFRTSISSLTSMPLSILLTIIIFYIFGITINTMTLGGIAVAIGDLVDDSIVDIEKHLPTIAREQTTPNRGTESPNRRYLFSSSEIRNSIVYATLIVVLVVVPLFMMSGLERSFVCATGDCLHCRITMLTSCFVDLYTGLGKRASAHAPFLADKREPLFMRWLKSVDERMLRWTLNRPRLCSVALAC